MIARHIEVNLKPEKLVEFKKLYENEILPLIKRQTGFLDSITLTPENVNDKSVTITLWRTKQDCENYHKRELSQEGISEDYRHSASVPEGHAEDRLLQRGVHDFPQGGYGSGISLNRVSRANQSGAITRPG